MKVRKRKRESKRVRERMGGHGGYDPSCPLSSSCHSDVDVELRGDLRDGESAVFAFTWRGWVTRALFKRKQGELSEKETETEKRNATKTYKLFIRGEKCFVNR